MKVHEALCSMVISPNWRIWRQSSTTRAENIKRMILDDSWWDRAKYLLNFIEPILSIICYIDMDMPCFGEVYDGINSMVEKMKAIINEKEKDPEETFFNQLLQIIVERWNKMTTPLHLLAFALSPKYYSQELLTGTRVAPYRDPEVAQGYKATLCKLFHQDLWPAVRAEFMSFSSANDCGLEALWDKSRSPAHSWWYFHGEAYQQLQPTTIKILSQVLSY